MSTTWNWEELCGPGGLHSWNETSKDFGVCFQQLFLHVPVFCILALVSGYYVGYRRDWVIREKTQERAIACRNFVTMSLAFIPVIKLYFLVTSVRYEIYPIDFLTGSIGCFSWLMHFGYTVVLRHRLGTSSRGSVFLLVCWTSSATLTAVILRSRVTIGDPIGFDITTLVLHFLYFLTLIPSSHSQPTFYSPCLVGSQHHNEYTPLLPYVDEDLLDTAMQDASIWSRLTFTWIEPLFGKALDNKLKDTEDLFDVPEKYSCSYVGARMDHALVGDVDQYQQFEERPHEPFITSTTGYGATSETSPITPTRRVLIRPLRRHNVTLLRALHKCFGLEFYSIGMLRFVSDMAGFAGPLLLNRLLIFVQDDSIDFHYGYLYAAGLVASCLVSAIFNTHFNWLMTLIGIKMRGAIVATILRKTLSVTEIEMSKSFSVGEITNFMSTDTDRIVNSCPSFHALWSIPLQLFVTLFLLYHQVGVAFLAGVAFSVILIPINKLIANKIAKLSTELMKHKDDRVTLMTDLLKGIRTVKMHVWEDYFIQKVSGHRASELRYLRGRKYLDAICVVLWATTPVLVAAFTIGTYVYLEGELDASTVFTTVALVNMLIGPLNAFPWVLNGLTEAWVSIKRIQRLLEIPDMDNESYYDHLNMNNHEDAAIIIKHATFSWAKSMQKSSESKATKKNKGKHFKNSRHKNEQEQSGTDSKEPFSLKDINLEVGQGQLIGIVGPSGSGKTSLLLAIIGDMIKKSGEIQIPENIDGFGYVSQKPWLIRGTIRDNIIFGKPYDELKFISVVDACALTEDLDALGWNCSVGESGCTLSGGQRARISLARALYHDKQVYLLDDTLSGVDAHVSAAIMQRCVFGLLRQRTRIFVTHEPRLLKRAALVYVLRGGRIVHCGPPESVLPEIEDLLPQDAPLGEEPMRMEPYAELDDKNKANDEESMVIGSVHWGVVMMYLKNVGCAVSIAVLMSLILMQFSQNLTFLWLSHWVTVRSGNSTQVDVIHENTSLPDHGFHLLDDVAHFVSNTTTSILEKFRLRSEEVTTSRPVLESSIGKVATVDMYYLEIYFGLAGLNLLFTIMRAFLFAYGGVKAAKKIHWDLLNSVVQAQVSFFDTTPTGRIVNRFSSDTYTVDDSLPFILNILLAQLFALIGAVSVCMYALPITACALVPLIPVYWWLQRRYRHLARNLKRLQSVALSPLYAHFSDTLAGLRTIRALSSRSLYWRGGAELVEAWQRAALSGGAAAQWLALRLQAASAAVLASAAAAAMLQRYWHAADAGVVGLAISYALSMTSMLGGVLTAFTETEREMIAVERVGEYTNQVESEKKDGDFPPYGWPNHGVVEYENVTLKYKSGAVGLRGVSFVARPGVGVGVAGRTGAGKSSLLHALAATHPLAHGQLTLDGVPTHTLQLCTLRSRIGVIPQEPFIFGGSILENVDPLGAHSEAQVLQALERSGLAGGSGGDTADAWLHSPATHLSRGHAQLLCIARVLLQRPKVVLIDEATANLDHETERVVLERLQVAFSGSTVIQVAHRIRNVLECDQALIMGEGRVLEFGDTASLIADPTSRLYALVHASNVAA